MTGDDNRIMQPAQGHQTQLSIFDATGREIKDRNSATRQHFETSALDQSLAIDGHGPANMVKERQSISQGHPHQRGRNRKEGAYLRIHNPIIKGIGPDGLEVGSFFTRKSNNSSSMGGHKTKVSLGIDNSSMDPVAGVISGKQQQSHARYIALEPSLRNYPSQPVGRKPQTSSSVRHKPVMLQRGSPVNPAGKTMIMPQTTTTPPNIATRGPRPIGASINQTSQITRGTVSTMSNPGRVTVDNIDLRMQKKNYHHKFYQILNNIPPSGGPIAVVKQRLDPKPQQQQLPRGMSEQEYRSSSAQQVLNVRDYGNLNRQRFDFFSQTSMQTGQKHTVFQTTNNTNPFSQKIIQIPMRGRSVSPNGPLGPPTIILQPMGKDDFVDVTNSTRQGSIDGPVDTLNSHKKGVNVKSGTASSQMSPIRMGPVDHYNKENSQYSQINEWQVSHRNPAENSLIQQTDTFVNHVESIETKHESATPILRAANIHEAADSTGSVDKLNASVDLIQKHWSSPDRDGGKETQFLSQSVASAGADLEHVHPPSRDEENGSYTLVRNSNNRFNANLNGNGTNDINGVKIQSAVTGPIDKHFTLPDEQSMQNYNMSKRIEERSILAEGDGSISHSTAFAANSHSAVTKKLPKSSEASVSVSRVSRQLNSRKPIRIGKVVALKAGKTLNAASDFDGDRSRSHTPHTPKSFNDQRQSIQNVDINTQGVSQAIVMSGQSQSIAATIGAHRRGGRFTRNDMIKSGPKIGQTQNIYMLLKDHEDTENERDSSREKVDANATMSATQGAQTSTTQNYLIAVKSNTRSREKESHLNIEVNMRVKQIAFQTKPDSVKKQVHQIYGARSLNKKIRPQRKSMVVVNRDFSRPGEPSPNSKATLHGSSNTQIFNNKLIQNNTQKKLDMQSSHGRSSIFGGAGQNVQDLISQKVENKDNILGAQSSPKSPGNFTLVKKKTSFDNVNCTLDRPQSNASSMVPGAPVHSQNTCRRFMQREQKNAVTTTLSRPDSHGSSPSHTAVTLAQARARMVNTMVPVKITRKQISNPNEDMFPVMDQTYAENFQHPRLTKTLNLMPGAQPSQRMNEFEEEVNGISLGKLFSIYGPSSQQIMARQKHIQNKQQSVRKGKQTQRVTSTTPTNRTGNELAAFLSNHNLRNSRMPVISPATHTVPAVALELERSYSKSSDLIPIFKRLVQGNVVVKANNQTQMGADNTPPVYTTTRSPPDLYKFEQNVQADQMAMLRNLFGDGSLNDLLFPNSNVAQRKTVNQSAPLQKQQSSRIDEDSGSYDSEDDAANDAEENAQYIIQMLGAMMTKRKTVPECMAICKQIDLDKVRADIRAKEKRDRCKACVNCTGFTEKSKERALAVLQQQEHLSQKTADNPVLNNRIKLEQSRIKKAEQKAKYDKENPFFKALQIQKQEREQFMQMEVYNHSDLPLPQSDEGTSADGAISEESSPDIITVNDSYIKDEPATNQNDVFKITALADDDDKDGDKLTTEEPIFKQRLNQPTITDSALGSIADPDLYSSNVTVRKETPETFCFYALKIDVPKSKLQKLGDFSKARPDQINAIQGFILQTWPVLKKRKIAFKVGVDEHNEAYNVIVVNIGKGRDALGQVPLSLCCKMNVIFQFSRVLGGRLICTESLCSHNPIASFFYDMQLQERLFPGAAEDAYVKNENYWGYDVRPSGHIKILQNSRPKQVSSSVKNSTTQNITGRFNRAVSHEITRRVKRGSIKTSALDEVIGRDDFQDDAMKSTMYVSELMKLIIGTQKNKTKKRMSRKKQIELKETVDQISQVLGIFPQRVHHFNASEDYANKKVGNNYKRLDQLDSDSWTDTRFTQLAAKGI